MLPRLAHAAAAAGDVERHRAEVALLDELDAGTGLDHLAGDLVPEDQTLGRGGAAAHHVLVGAADVGRDDLQDRPVRDLASDVGGIDARPVLQLERREVDVLYLDLAWAHVGDASVVSHTCPSLLYHRFTMRGRRRRRRFPAVRRAPPPPVASLVGRAGPRYPPAFPAPARARRTARGARRRRRRPRRAAPRGAADHVAGKVAPEGVSAPDRAERAAGRTCARGSASRP